MPPSPSSPPNLNDKNASPTMQVTAGGKTWEVNPNLSYQATGIWTNPNPRSLMDEEKVRLKTIQSEIQTLESKLEQLNKESDFLLRIEKSHIKIRFDFGCPPHLSSREIIDLGEFTMKLDEFTPTSTVP